LIESIAIKILVYNFIFGGIYVVLHQKIKHTINIKFKNCIIIRRINVLRRNDKKTDANKFQISQGIICIKHLNY